MTEPAGADGDRELTVDQLAAVVGVTVRNVRAYAARGLLPPPRLVGRTGYYGREHVARLRRVREMLVEGYSLNMIERTLAAAPEAPDRRHWRCTGRCSRRGCRRNRRRPPPPNSPPVPASPRTSTWSTGWSRSGVERLDDGRLRVLDPALLTAGLQVVELGVPPSALIEAQRTVTEHVRRIAQTHVRMFVETGWRALAEGGATPEQLERAQTTVARLQPAAAPALLAVFRREMAATVEVAVQDELGKLAEDPSPG